MAETVKLAQVFAEVDIDGDEIEVTVIEREKDFLWVATKNQCLTVSGTATGPYQACLMAGIEIKDAIHREELDTKGE